MRLYEIDARLEALLEQVDPETGELTCDMEQLEALTIAREEKLEGLALAVKNYESDAAQIRAEEKALAERRRALENKAERARAFLKESLAGEAISTARVTMSYRRSEAVEIRNEDKFWAWCVDHPEFARRKDPEPELTKIKAAIKAGQSIPGAEIVERVNMTIK